ncbi:hypothetical protein KP509_17G008500 [Ceratopteris richardii]|uniref:Photolyase/cryptochrome alpha/beta domain-containing protein n=1 Tax=Ceratopteris richardii TaxID=49495 RepID=A0A8T2SVG0_CERRI|nr:hypothetical protein KP509_17G008500 [Ceratopteris richardii]KAH7372537.1 hypothetical protein KP509_17G008500 [Ceratopteris richardii]
MANSLKELEALMEHNSSLSGSGSSGFLRSPDVREDEGGLTRRSSTNVGDSEEASHVDDLQQSDPRLPPFAALSLAFASSLPSTLLSSPNIAHASNTVSSPVKAALISPSIKKCPLPISPFMPSISAAALGTETYFSMPSSKTRRSSTAFPDYQRLPDKNNNYGEPNNGAAIRRASIVWFRSDLRVHDNEALATASKESLSILPVYCFDPRDYGKSSSGFDKTGPYRAKFLLECVSNLRDNLRARGSELVVRVGKPEEVLVSLASSIGADAIYAHQEIACQEVASEKRVSAALQEQGVEVKYFWGSTLFHVEDLPFKVEEMPITYSGFREKVQKINVRQALEAPKRLKGIPSRGGVEPGNIPTIEELGLKPMMTQHQDRSSVAQAGLVGGESEALRRLKSFGDEQSKQSVSRDKVMASGESLYGANFSCKISPWLAMGCLSPRRMFEDLHKSGKRAVNASASTASHGTDNGLNWLLFELLWRDFFRFITKKYALSKQNAEVVTASAVPV